jgi:hypothetical protein
MINPLGDRSYHETEERASTTSLDHSITSSFVFNLKLVLGGISCFEPMAFLGPSCEDFWSWPTRRLSGGCTQRGLNHGSMEAVDVSIPRKSALRNSQDRIRAATGGGCFPFLRYDTMP